MKVHAEHNEAACDFLLADGRFCDWVVTTAFYSALRYVNHEMFPLTDSGVTYQNFDVYYNQVLHPRNRSTNKHRETKNLVAKHLRPINKHYRWLYDTCMNARYGCYTITPREAQLARDNLTELKKHLKK